MDEELISLAHLGAQIRDGLFLAPSRSYGEQYVEPFIRYKYGFSKPGSGDHDAVGSDGVKYEIKCCKVLVKNPKVSNTEPLIKRVLAENNNSELNRLIPFSHADFAEYFANVQNVKRDHFDFLIYVLLFEDCLKVFKVETSKIKLEHIPNWSDKHGRYDAPGKSGQFPITKKNIRHHIDNYLIDTITYEEMAEAYQVLSK